MTDEIDDRLSRRFEETDATDETDHETVATETEESQSGSNGMNSQTDRNSQQSQKAQNIKKEWNVRSFYLDDDLDGTLSTAYKRLDLDISEADAEISLKKTRHFYPLIVRLGLQRLERMSVTEVTEELERMEHGE